MLNDVRILRHVEDTQFTHGGTSTKGVKTSFMVGDDGPFSVFLRDEQFTPESNLRLIEEKADAVRASRAGIERQR